MIQSHDPQFNDKLAQILNEICVNRLDENYITISRGNKSILLRNENGSELKDILSDLADGYQDPYLKHDKRNNVLLKTIFTDDEIDTFPLSGGA